MHLIQGTRKEPVLPQVAAASVETIDVLSVKLIGAFQGIGERGLALRRDDKMDVIGHQTVAINRQTKTLRRLGQKGQELPTVVIYKENILAVIAPLSNMMRTAFNYDSRSPWHDDIIANHVFNANRNNRK
jgi:hypothetical protein